MTAVRDPKSGKFRPSPGRVAADVIASGTEPPVEALDVRWTASGPTDSLVGYGLASEWSGWPLPELPPAEPDVAGFECPIDHQHYHSADTVCSVSWIDGMFADHDPALVVPVAAP